MKLNTLSLIMILSTLILSAVASARLTNETIPHTGILAIPGANSITLSQHAGRTITLNKGYLEIKTTKVPMGFSLLTPQLVIKQNGQTMYIDVDTDGYQADEESFNLLSKDSDLNYDLYLRRSTTSTKDVQAITTQACTYQELGTKCGIDVDGKYNCIVGMQDKSGVQKVRNTTADVTVSYKLTLGQKNVAKAEFTSAQTTTELKKSEELSACK
ncbi:MAG: hypothetical protein H7177_03150 [Rhizobacter sp.]|nr:hypothetical protein [Bacteriovorax sp.]